MTIHANLAFMRNWVGLGFTHNSAMLLSALNALALEVCVVQVWDCKIFNQILILFKIWYFLSPCFPVCKAWTFKARSARRYTERILAIFSYFLGLGFCFQIPDWEFIGNFTSIFTMQVLRENKQAKNVALLPEKKCARSKAKIKWMVQNCSQIHHVEFGTTHFWVFYTIKKNIFVFPKIC